MNIKKLATLDNLVKVGLGVLTVGSFLLSSKKESMDLEKLKGDVAKEVLAELSENSK